VNFVETPYDSLKYNKYEKKNKKNNFLGRKQNRKKVMESMENGT